MKSWYGRDGERQVRSVNDVLGREQRQLHQRTRGIGNRSVASKCEHNDVRVAMTHYGRRVRQQKGRRHVRQRSGERWWKKYWSEN